MYKDGEREEGIGSYTDITKVLRLVHLSSTDQSLNVVYLKGDRALEAHTTASSRATSNPDFWALVEAVYCYETR